MCLQHEYMCPTNTGLIAITGSLTECQKHSSQLSGLKLCPLPQKLGGRSLLQLLQACIQTALHMSRSLIRKHPHPQYLHGQPLPEADSLVEEKWTLLSVQRALLCLKALSS